MILIDYDHIKKFLSTACEQYEKSAPTVTSYCDDLYQRLDEGGTVQVEELRIIQALEENGIWATPHRAANLVYHLCDRVGLPTVGQIGF